MTESFEELHDTDEELKAIDSLPISEDEKIVAAGELVEEPSWAETFAKTMRANEATGQAKAAVQDAAEEAEEEEVDPDKMEVVSNRSAKRNAYNLRGSIQVGRSRVRRRIHRVLVKRGYWQ